MPGRRSTSELHFVAALDQESEMRAILGLFGAGEPAPGPAVV